MEQSRFKSEGITLRAVEGGKWTAEAEYRDSGFAIEQSAKGIVKTSYRVDTPEIAVSVVKDAVESLGIEWDRPQLFYYLDAEGVDSNRPQNWQTILKTIAERLGWNCGGVAGR
jgi:hypothetical protein